MDATRTWPVSSHAIHKYRFLARLMVLLRNIERVVLQLLAVLPLRWRAFVGTHQTAPHRIESNRAWDSPNLYDRVERKESINSVEPRGCIKFFLIIR